ncbi:hypothetical protein ABW19_dt0204179 [Dactylella cylindrospora]|nr:hypothetical protein ABW19_dt0204179 [Dactylella cylindrospora]
MGTAPAGWPPHFNFVNSLNISTASVLTFNPPIHRLLIGGIPITAPSQNLHPLESLLQVFFRFLHSQHLRGIIRMEPRWRIGFANMPHKGVYTFLKIVTLSPISLFLGFSSRIRFVGR